MIGADLAVARHFASIAVGHYRRAHRPMDARMLAYLDALARGFTDETPPGSEESQSEHDVPLSADQAAEILGCTPQWIRRIASDLDGRRVAGRWVFSRRAVLEYAEARRGAA